MALHHATALAACAGPGWVSFAAVSITFADLTTMRVGGPIGRLHVATSTEHAVELFRAAAGADEPLLVMGGGSS